MICATPVYLLELLARNAGNSACGTHEEWGIAAGVSALSSVRAQCALLNIRIGGDAQHAKEG